MAEDLVSRPYQEQLEVIASRKNTIIHLPTGSGKTFIAVCLIRRFIEALQKPWGDGGKRTFFLVIVMTCQILSDMLNHSYIKIEDINLLIFDECHHAVDDHPMRLCSSNSNESNGKRVWLRTNHTTFITKVYNTSLRGLVRVNCLYTVKATIHRRAHPPDLSLATSPQTNLRENVLVLVSVRGSRLGAALVVWRRGAVRDLGAARTLPHDQFTMVTPAWIHEKVFDETVIQKRLITIILPLACPVKEPIKLTTAFPEPTESREKALYDFIYAGEGYGFLTQKPLPKLCAFPTFMTIGEERRSLLITEEGYKHKVVTPWYRGTILPDSSRMNCLLPRAATIKALSDKQAKMISQVLGDDKPRGGYSEVFLAEFCIRYEFPESLYQLQKQKINMEYPWDSYDDFVSLPMTSDQHKLAQPQTRVVPVAAAIKPPPLKYVDKIALLQRRPTGRGPELREVLSAITTINSHDTFCLERAEMLGDSFLKFAATLFLYHKNLYYAGERLNIGGRMKVEQFSPRKDFLVPGFFAPKELQDFIEDK
ncbi:Dicer 2, partial [Operophtera brumata]